MKRIQQDTEASARKRTDGLRVVRSRSCNFVSCCPCAKKRHHKRFVQDQITKRTRRLCSSNSIPQFKDVVLRKGAGVFLTRSVG